MDAEALSSRLAAAASPQRLRILALLAAGEQHVSEIARRVGLSRPVLYMHLSKLEEAGYVSGRLALSADGKALKFFRLLPFSLILDPAAVVAAVGPLPVTPKESP